MDVSTLLARANSGLQNGTIYSSPGKMPSFAASTWPNNAKNDCSGFVSWCLRFSESRKVNHPLYIKVNGGWFDTEAIHRDGMEPTGYFRRLDRAQPGAFLVYPDYKGNDGKRHDGHIGIVAEVNGDGVAGVSRVIHCSLGNFKATGDAIQVTGPDAWKKMSDSIIVWFDGLAS